MAFEMKKIIFICLLFLLVTEKNVFAQEQRKHGLLLSAGLINVAQTSKAIRLGLNWGAGYQINLGNNRLRWVSLLEYGRYDGKWDGLERHDFNMFGLKNGARISVECLI